MASEETRLLIRKSSHSDRLNTEQVQEADHTSSPGTQSKKRKILIAVLLSVMALFQNVSYSLIAPFYPTEATSKGATMAEVGLIFSVFELVRFIMAPVYGSNINKIGPKFMFISGTFLLGGSNIAFGFLDRSPDGWVYVLMCFICRIVESNGAALMTVSAFAIMIHTFPEDVGRATSVLEMCCGAGLVFGRSVGGFLYEAGGFLLPFLVVGGTLLTLMLVCIVLLPSIERSQKEYHGFSQVLKIPSCVWFYFFTVCAAISMTYLDPTFSVWILESFPETSMTQIALMFTITPSAYFLSAPLSGYLSDKGYAGGLAIAGTTTGALGFLLLGPSPLLQTFITNSIPLVAVTLALLGLSNGTTIVAIYSLVTQLMRSRGFEDSIETYGLVSGFVNSAINLGAFVGPIIASSLMSSIGFAWTCSVCTAIDITMALAMIAYVLIMKHNGKWPFSVASQSNVSNADYDSFLDTELM